MTHRSGHCLVKSERPGACDHWSTPPRLLDEAVDDLRDPRNNLSHPMRILEGWLTDTSCPSQEFIGRRGVMVQCVREWSGAQRGPTRERALTVVRAIGVAFDPNSTSVERDAGLGMNITVHSSTLGEEATRRLADLWKEVGPLACESAEHSDALSALFQLHHKWHYWQINQRDEGLEKLHRDLAAQILEDIANWSGRHPGVQHRVAEIARDTCVSVAVELDPHFEILFPEDKGIDDRKAQDTIQRAVAPLVEAFASRGPAACAPTIRSYEDEAALGQVRTWFSYMPELAHGIANRVQDPLAWARELLNTGCTPRFLRPFLDKAEGLDAALLLSEFLSDAACRRLFYDALFCLEAPPESLMAKALDIAPESLDAITSLTMCHAVPLARFESLLNHTSPQVRCRTALDLWDYRRVDRPGIQAMDKWRNAVLAGVHCDPGRGETRRRS